MSTLAVKNNNPGDLRFAGQPGAVPGAGGFASFPDQATGTAALENDLKAKVTGNTKTGLKPTSTIAQFASTYAPASDGNDPGTYAENLAKQLGVTTDTPLAALQGRIHDFASAVAHNEDATSTLDKASTSSYASQQISPLTHSQLISNINAMEQQGAKPEEIQSYLDSLKGSPQQTNTQSSGAGLPAAPVAPKPLLSAQDDLAGSAPTQAPDNLGTDLSKRLQEGTAAASEGIAAASQGNIGGAASGLIQTAGAAGGAVGDVVNRGMELIPGVKGVENLIGQGVGALAKTPVGQKVVQSIQDFSNKHPELAKDIGAGFNIVTAIPILRGLGVAGDIAGDAVAQSLKGVAEKSAQEGFGAVVSSTKTGASALAKNPDVIKTLIDERAIPDIEGGKYTTQEASAKLDEAISHIEDTELQPELAKANSPAVSTKFPFADILKNAEMEATQAQEDFAPVKKELGLIQKKYGDYLTLQQINDAKRVVANKISQAAYGSPDSSAMKVARSVLQQSVEDGAKTLGLQDVGAINQKMARLIKAQNILKYIDRKPVKTGLVGGILKDVGTGAGELAGNATGIPFAGAYVGRETGGLIARKVTGIRNGILNRTGQGAVRTPLKKAAGAVTQGLVAAGAQKSTKRP